MVRAIGVEDDRVLTVGDKAAFPGNDYDLLARPWAVSVDESASSARHAWNIFSAGARGTVATEKLLRALRTGRRGARLELEFEVE